MPRRSTVHRAAASLLTRLRARRAARRSPAVVVLDQPSPILPIIEWVRHDPDGTTVIASSSPTVELHPGDPGYLPPPWHEELRWQLRRGADRVRLRRGRRPPT